MKYIVTENEYCENEIFIFPEIVSHDVMANAVKDLRLSLVSVSSLIRVPVSAGFVKNGKCTGESISLRLKCNPERDNALLKTVTN